MITLTASSINFSNQVSAPQDGVDNVAQASVVPGYQTLVNNTAYIARTQSYTRPHISVGTQSDSAITIFSYKGLWCSVTAPQEQWKEFEGSSPITLTSANLDTPGMFVASTNYYIYFTGIPNTFEISTATPDSTGTFKVVAGNEVINRRYVGSFITDASAKIMHFMMTDFKYNFATPSGLTNCSSVAFVSSMPSDLIFTNLPVLATKVDLYLILNNTAAVAGEEIFSYTAKGSEAYGYTDITSIKGQTIRYIVPAFVGFSTRRLTIKTNTASGDVGAKITWIGYTE